MLLRSIPKNDKVFTKASTNEFPLIISFTCFGYSFVFSRIFQLLENQISREKNYFANYQISVFRTNSDQIKIPCLYRMWQSKWWKNFSYSYSSQNTFDFFLDLFTIFVYLILNLKHDSRCKQ